MGEPCIAFNPLPWILMGALVGTIVGYGFGKIAGYLSKH